MLSYDYNKDLINLQDAIIDKIENRIRGFHAILVWVQGHHR